MKVSVIVPVYNVEKYLCECLDSVLGQTLADIEVICVDDGSTDGSAAILARYAAKDPRIRVITQANSGLSAARNAGMDVATGEYIYFLDSDDWIADDAMKRCVGICERDSLDQLVFGCRIMAESDVVNGKFLSRKEAYYRLPGSIDGEVMDGAKFLRETIRKGGYFPSVPMRLMRRAVLVDSGLRFPTGLIHEDEYFTPLLIALSGRVAVVGERFYVRRLRDGSITTKKDGDAMGRHIAHALLICVRLRNDAELIGLSREGMGAVVMAIDRLHSYLVGKICRSHVSVRDMYRRARNLAKPNEKRRLAGLCVRLAVSVAAHKCIRRFRRLVGRCYRLGQS